MNDLNLKSEPNLFDHKPRSGIFSGAMWIIISTISCRALGLIFLTVLAARASIEDFGHYCFLLSYFVIFEGISDGGTQRALVRRMTDNKENALILLRQGLGFDLIFSCFVVALCLVINYVFFSTRLEYFLVALKLPFNSAFLALEAWVKYQYKMNYSAFSYFSGRLFFVLAASFGVINGAGLGFVIIMWVLGDALCVSLLWFLAGRPMPILNKNISKELFFDALPLTLLFFLSNAAERLDILFVRFFMSIEDMALYGVAAKISEMTGIIPSAIIAASFPLFSLYKSDEKKMVKIVEKCFFSIFLLIFIIIISGQLYPREILGLFYGEKFLSAAPLLSILLWGRLFFSWEIININLMIAHGLERKAVKFMLLKLLAGAFFLGILGNFFGLFGVAFSFLLFSAFMSALGSGISNWKRIAKSGLYSLMTVLLSTLPAWILASLLGPVGQDWHIRLRIIPNIPIFLIPLFFGYFAFFRKKIKEIPRLSH